MDTKKELDNFEIKDELLDEEYYDDFEDEIDLLIEEEILDEVDLEFSDTIKDRGIDYYENGYVISCKKCDNEYYAKVQGRDDNVYDVNVTIDDFGINYWCTCPCDFPCKHEYATLIAIFNGDYKKVDLKPYLKRALFNLTDIIEKIPAEEVKEYLLLSLSNDETIICIKSFEEYFSKYLPKEDYEYYYNRLYNSLILENDYKCIVNNYFSKINKYNKNMEFSESFKIVKSIIESFKDSNMLNDNDYIVSIFPNLGMYLRIIYRKSDEVLKSEISNWFKEVEIKEYYNNLYLEDIIISIK